jgi:hypothetical protein
LNFGIFTCAIISHWICSAVLAEVPAPRNAAFVKTQNAIIEQIKSIPLEKSQVVVFSLDPTHAGAGKLNNEEFFHGYYILGKVQIAEETERSILMSELAQGIQEGTAVYAMCFNPRHGLMVSLESASYDFCICFECASIKLHGLSQRQVQTSGSPAKMFNQVLDKYRIERFPNEKSSLDQKTSPLTPKKYNPGLKRGAQLKFPEAERWLAHLIKEKQADHKGFGDSPQDAVEKLLKSAARTYATACRELADAYCEGYFGKVDEVAARIYWEKGANLGDRMCWEELAQALHKGRGGPQDLVEAYYWISLEARCVDPESVGGEETWKVRNQLAAQLSLADLENLWKRIDVFMEMVHANKIIVDSPPFGGTAVKAEAYEAAKKASDEWELRHRKKLRERK